MSVQLKHCTILPSPFSPISVYLSLSPFGPFLPPSLLPFPTGPHVRVGAAVAGLTGQHSQRLFPLADTRDSEEETRRHRGEDYINIHVRVGAAVAGLTGQHSQRLFPLADTRDSEEETRRHRGEDYINIQPTILHRTVQASPHAYITTTFTASVLITGNQPF